jgi:GT2 family glycosyltransferase
MAIHAEHAHRIRGRLLRATPERIVDGHRLVNWWTANQRILNADRMLSDFDKNFCLEVSYLTGWETLVPVRVFQEVGLYDDKHFQRCGDTELPVRRGTTAIG